MQSRILIIGAGVIGASVAYHLSERGGNDILLLERASAQGGGSTGKATGGVRAQFETDINILMSKYSIDFFANWDIDCGYDPKGYLFFATENAQLERLDANVQNQVRLGIKDVDIVDVQTIGTMVPGINCADIVGGSFGRHDGFIDPLAVMRGFTEIALQRGARIRFETSAESLVVANGTITAVATDRGVFECDAVIVCGGAWSREIAATAEIHVPVEPVRRQIVWAKTRRELPAVMPMVVDAGSGFHFRPARDFTGADHASDQVLLACPEEGGSTSFNTDFDDTFIATVCRLAIHRAEFFEDSTVMREKCRAGLYENTPDRHAIIGGCDVRGLYFATGFSGHGVMHSPAAGRAISENVLDGQSKFLDINCLRLSRFSEGELPRETTSI